MLPYIVLFLSSFVFSQWSFNRAIAIGGKLEREPKAVDVIFGLAIVGLVWSLKLIL